MQETAALESAKHEMKRAFWIASRTWEDNITIDLKETVCEGVDWIRLAQDRVQWMAFVRSVMNLRAP
jgi:hypothetical protein